MRLRSAAAAAVSALALLVALPTAARAADGAFTYGYVGPDGVQRGVLSDPESGECITLPEVADPASSLPAFAPNNDTTSRALVFTGPHCDGDRFPLRARGGHASERLELRSVFFLD